MGFKLFFWLIFGPLLAFGFQVIPRGNSWEISAQSATTAKLFIVYSSATQAIQNDLPVGDILAGTDTVTVQQIMNSVMSDFNSVSAAFVSLVDSSDADFTQYGEGRTIIIENGDVSGATSGGEAQQTMTGRTVTGCRIVFRPLIYNAAKLLTASITHELGHCLGLNHPMETVNSIMSYYVDKKIVRLQIDDKMGLVYLYPTDPAKAKEEPTLGMACSRK